MLMDDCLFCKIIRGEAPSTKVFESERVLGFRDIYPQAKEHVLFIPKKHIATMNDVTGDDWSYIGEMIQAAVQTARELGIAESGYRIVNNSNKEGGQVIYHVHYHLIGGEQLGGINAKRNEA